TWDGTAWSSLLPLTSDAISDTAPALAYDAGGQPVVVWRRGGDLVMQAGWGGSPTPVRPGSTAGAFLDFVLSASPEGQLALLWQALSPSGADLAYSVYDAANASWGADNVLMQDRPTEEAFAPAFAADGALLAAYNKVTVELVTLTYDISPTLTITVPSVPQPVQTDLYLLEHSLGCDLALDSADLVLSDPNPAPGSSVAISATVHNRGDLAVSGGQLAFYDGDPAAGGTLIGSVQPLPEPFRAATTATVSVAWAVPAAVVSHTLYAVADPAGSLPEFDEGNNQAAQAAVLPDLALIWAHSGYRTRTITLQAAVENAGVIPWSAPFSLTFRAGDPLSGTLLGRIVLTDSLAAGQQFSLSLVLDDPAALAGTDLFWALAGGGPALEFAYDNNAAYGVLWARPDLALEAMDIAGEWPVWVTVHNRGPLTVTRAPLAVWSGGFSGSLLYSGSLGALGPGQSAAVRICPPLGELELWAQADPNNLLAEGDEGNNLAVRARTVRAHLYLPLVGK
ncbi:MAG: hypothetical protein JXA37_06505, partial [Chloroflexia bacterium]|nr:hypothetical protein [Chloroflexia bacterium]